MLTADGEVRRVSYVELEILEEPVVVYNFEVADWHTYYVSEEEGLLEAIKYAKMLPQFQK